MNELVPLMYNLRLGQATLTGRVQYRRFRGEEDDSSSSDLELTAAGPQWTGPAVTELIKPSWLLADYELRIVESTQFLGRQAYFVEATRRETSKGFVFSRSYVDRASAVVDAATGILLRYEMVDDYGEVSTAEFADLVVSGEPADHAGAGVSDEVLNLLYRTELQPPRFSARLHEWADQGAQAKIAGRLIAQSSESRLVQRLGRFTAGHTLEQTSLYARISVAAPASANTSGAVSGRQSGDRAVRYRIDFERDRAPKVQSTICDGERRWLIHTDRVVIKGAKPLPAGLSLMADLSWLLDGLELTSAGSATVAGRDTVLICAVPDDDHEGGTSPLSNGPVLANKIETSVDAELGIALSQQWHFDDQLVLRTELADVQTDVDDDAFRYEVPRGIRVVVNPNPLAEAGVSPGMVVRQAAASILTGFARRLGGGRS
ncbi:MAG TPA: hypothetical protein VFI65_29720 [Streptosporangiaceae bacterium]|nr:hypothetical protein [Streptosporangiaceae bacterium]